MVVLTKRGQNLARKKIPFSLRRAAELPPIEEIYYKCFVKEIMKNARHFI